MNKHGGYFGNDRQKTIDFSVNINPLGVPELLKEKLIISIDNLISYPEIDGESGKCLLSNKLNIGVENIILGNGATELIYLFAKTFKPRKVLIVEPTFTEYERAFNLNGSEISHFKTHEDDDFKINIDELIKDLEHQKPDVLVICNPNNPTGTVLDVRDIEVVIEKLKQIECKLFVDESFIDFTQHKSFISLIDKSSIFLLRSMTKIYAIPGLRLGYALANRDMIKDLSKNKEPWTINSLALESIEVLLKDDDYITKTNNWYMKEKKYLKERLQEINSLKIYESEGNFFLCKLKTSDSIVLRDYLVKKGIYIRTCEDFYGLDDSFIRLALRTRGENEKLISELLSFFKCT